MSHNDESVIIGMEVRSLDGEAFPVDIDDVTSPYDFVDTVLVTCERGESVVLYEIRNGVRKSLYQKGR